MNPEHVRRETFLTHLNSSESPLRAFIAGALARADERADFFQEVVLLLWRTYDRFDASRPFLPWALGIASRRLKEEYRRLQRRPGLLQAEHLDRLAAAIAGQPADQPREEAALEECLSALPGHAARLIQRRYYENAAMESLSAETGQSTAALYQTLSRLRRRLADCIRQRLAPAETRTAVTHER